MFVHILLGGALELRVEKGGGELKCGANDARDLLISMKLFLNFHDIAMQC